MRVKLGIPERNAWNGKADASALDNKANAYHSHKLTDIANNTFDKLSEPSGFLFLVAETIIRRCIYWAATKGQGYSGSFSLGFKVKLGEFGRGLISIGTNDDRTAFTNFEFCPSGDLCVGNNTFHHSGNLKIIRGAVNTNSNGIWCSGGQIEKIEPNYVKVTHNIGHTRYSATATAHAETVEVRGDNVVTVFTKGANYTLFMVTDGQGNRNEPTAFDFIIIAE